MRLPLSAAAFAVVVLVTALTAAPAQAGSSVTVNAGTNYFCDPSYENGVCTTNVTTGDTVTWSVVDGIHTVTQCDASYADCPPAGGFDSGIVPEGNSFSQTFDSPGAYPYYCSLHPNNMRGVVNVAAATPSPSPTPVLTPEPGTTPTPGPTGGASPGSTPGAVPTTGGPPASEHAVPLPGLLALAVGGLAVACAAALAPGRRRPR